MSILYRADDVHKEAITTADFGPEGREPLLLQELSTGTRRIRHFFGRLRPPR